MPHDAQSPELLIVLLAATVIALVFERLRLQAVLGFLLAGALIGPHGLGILSDLEKIHELADIGMIFLMLTIGLEFSFARLHGLKKIAILGGSAQIGVSIGLSILFARWMGWPVYQGFVLGSVISLSSTAVVFRNLLDRAELESQHGRIAVAFLLFQDLAVGPLLIFITAFGHPAGSMAASIALSLAKAGLLLGGLWIVSVYCLPKVMRWVAFAKSREIFLLASVLLCFGVSWISAELGLSAALGAFFAGLMLANTDYHYQISGEITPFRHIFISIFFVSIGLLFDLGLVDKQLVYLFRDDLVFYVRDLVAFFQFADAEMYALTQAKAPPKVGSHYHIALKVGDATYEDLKGRLNRAGEKFRETDHGYCKSIYTITPDGMILEFTCDPPDVAEIDAMRRADAHSELRRWLGGDRQVNNQLRHRD